MMHQKTFYIFWNYSWHLNVSILNIFKDLFIYLRGKIAKRMFFHPLACSLKAAKAGVESIGSQEPGAPSRSPMWCKAQGFGLSSPAFPGILAGC